MAPCYNNMKNLHYRTQSLPEAVYNSHMLHMGHQDYHQAHLQALNDKLHGTHHSAAMKKRSHLRRSQTNVCDLVPSVAHHRAPLTAGVYEAFLPPPNLNAVGLPIGMSNLNYPRSRTQSFYVPNHHRSTSLSHQSLHQLGSSQHSLCRSDQMIGSYPMAQHHAKALRDAAGMVAEPKALSSQTSWYHRSVPNIPQAPTQPQSSLTTPLFVDCSVEYDLGDHPPIPANSEPLLSIHPEYVVKARSVNSSPYSMYQQHSGNHIRSHGKLKGVSPRLEKPDNHKSLPDIAGTGVNGYLHSRRLHHQQKYPIGRRLHRTSPLAITADKMEATRKLSVESRDSGIGLMNPKDHVSATSVGSVPWMVTSASQNCDESAVRSAETVQQSLPQPDYANRILNNNNNTKRSAFSDLVNGLLCCSTPVYNRPDLNLSLPEVDLKSTDWSSSKSTDWATSASALASAAPWREARTMEWVQGLQNSAAAEAAHCRAGVTHPGYCGQDCGDGFCYNVWNSMVHV